MLSIRAECLIAFGGLIQLLWERNCRCAPPGMSARGRVRKSTVGNGAKTRVSLYLWQRAFEWWTTGLWRIAPAEDMIASWRQMPGLGQKWSQNKVLLRPQSRPR